MNRRTQGVLLAGGLAAAAVAVLGLARGLDHLPCKVDLPSLSCKWSLRSSISFTPRTPQSSEIVDVTSWAVTTNAWAAIPAQLSEATGLPLPTRWVLATAKNSPLIKAVHVETPLDLAAVLGFYRVELSKRGWTENRAVVEADRAVIAFTTTDGPALLRLIHEDDRTIADLSLRKPAAANPDILPSHGQVKLMFGNDTDEAAVITINAQTIPLAAHAGRHLPDGGAERKLLDNPQIDLPPGKYKVTLKVASGAAQNREFEVAADEVVAAADEGDPQGDERIVVNIHDRTYVERAKD